MGKTEIINGKESVEDLIAMIDRNVDSAHAIIHLISSYYSKDLSSNIQSICQEFKKRKIFDF